MKKRIIICADGTWNRPEEDLEKDFPTNVLKLARAIKSFDLNGVSQQVFYDWGIGSYYDSTIGGITGRGMHKNIMDNYRYIVQNYSDGDEIYLFGFSRGSYTVRCLCGMINNCGILKRKNAKLIQAAFDLYKKPSKKYAPDGEKSLEFRKNYSHKLRDIKFIGVWDTVGALGIPFSFLGLFEDKDEFYDTKLGRNVEVARHALAIDELRKDFEPTIWKKRETIDIKQVWFSGAHSDIGGSYKPDKDGTSLADNALFWMIKEANLVGLDFEEHLKNNIKTSPLSKVHISRRKFFRLKEKYFRPINHKEDEILIHKSVKEKWDLDLNYRPKNLSEYIDKNGWPINLVE